MHSGESIRAERADPKIAQLGDLLRPSFVPPLARAAAAEDENFKAVSVFLCLDGNYLKRFSWIALLSLLLKPQV